MFRWYYWLLISFKSTPQVFNRAPYSKGCIYRHIQTLIRMAEDQQSPIAGPGLVSLYTVSKTDEQEVFSATHCIFLD